MQEKNYPIKLGDNCTIILASKKGHLEIVIYLTEQGANIRMQNDKALRLASQNGHLEVVKFLHNNGADIRANNDISNNCDFRKWSS